MRYGFWAALIVTSVAAVGCRGESGIERDAATPVVVLYDAPPIVIAASRKSGSGPERTVAKPPRTEPDTAPVTLYYEAPVITVAAPRPGREAEVACASNAVATACVKGEAAKRMLW